MNTRDYEVLAVIIVFTAWTVPGAVAQHKLAEGHAEAGRALALQACTGCHIVVPDQPFKPVYAGSPRPPDFKDIANKPNVTAASLKRFLESLPAIPKETKMPNPDLTSQEIKDVATFIVTLRDKSRK
jgi:mono/diheme cytochrome c family protein